MPNNSTQQSTLTKVYQVRLFIAGDAPNSRLARKNLKSLQAGLKGVNFKTEIIDVLKQPQLALRHGVYVTPALQVIQPEPGTLIFGNLSNQTVLKNLFPEDNQ